MLGVSGEADVRRVTALLARPEADLRRLAVRIHMARSKPDHHLSRDLEECLFDPDEGVRLAACLPAVPTRSPLYAAVAVEDGSFDVRVAATLAAWKADSRNVENLKRLVRVADPRPLGEIAHAVSGPKLLDELELRPALEQWTREGDLAERLAAFTTLARLDEKSAPRCERFLQSVLLGWDPAARIEAALAFRHPSPASVAVLTRRREVEREYEVRAAIDRALAKGKS